MAIEMNFGWLNDYTGSKFAPITLANLVLMDTSSGSTETLFDFIESEHDIFKENLKQHQGQINNNIRLLTRLTNIVPIDPTLPKEENQGEMKPAAAQRAVRLVAAAENGDCSWVDRDKKQIGINVGGLNRPVYFIDGVPQICYEGKTTDTIEVSYNDIDNNTIVRKMPDYAKTDGNNNYLLNANISGLAGSAKRAHEAIKAEYAQQAGASKTAKVSDTLASNMQFTGDVTGTVQTKTAGKYSSTELTLKTIDGLNPNETFGGELLTGTTVFTVPKIKVDTKGRIVSITETNITPKVALTKIADVDSGTTAGLVGWMGSADNPNFVGASTDATSGIYMDFSNKSEPILMGAAWNDYAEYRAQIEYIEAGYCVKSNDDGKVEKTTERLSACDGIVSDTFGFSIGKNDKYQTPLAVAGRVLAYYEGDKNDYHAGDVVCASENGKVCKMTREEIREYPDRIVGIVSEIPNYETWNNKMVNNRIWIKVK